jgi:hypothetical protein
MTGNILKQTVCESDKLSKTVYSVTGIGGLGIRNFLLRPWAHSESSEYDLYPDLHV